MSMIDLTLDLDNIDFGQAALDCFEARELSPLLGHMPATGRIVLSASRPRVVVQGDAATLRRLAELAVAAAELAEDSDARYHAQHPGPTDVDAGAGAAGTVEGVGR